ncbi:hypothetical protein [Streptomyces levis]
MTTSFESTDLIATTINKAHNTIDTPSETLPTSARQQQFDADPVSSPLA